MKVSLQSDRGVTRDCVDLMPPSTFSAIAENCGAVRLDWRMVVAYLACGLVALVSV